MSMQLLRVDNTDGVKLIFKDGWLLVRPSGTEPKIRITAEAESENQARRLYDGAVSALQSAAGEA